MSAQLLSSTKKLLQAPSVSVSFLVGATELGVGTNSNLSGTPSLCPQGGACGQAGLIRFFPHN